MSKKNKTINWYLRAMDQGQKAAAEFLESKDDLIKICGRSLFDEFVLNYQCHFQPSKKDIILSEFDRLIRSKSKHYTSDIAIAYMILKNVSLSTPEEDQFVDFLFERLKDEMSPNLVTSPAFTSPKARNVKKRIVIEAAGRRIASRRC